MNISKKLLTEWDRQLIPIHKEQQKKTPCPTRQQLREEARQCIERLTALYPTVPCPIIKQYVNAITFESPWRLKTFLEEYEQTSIRQDNNSEILVNRDDEVIIITEISYSELNPADIACVFIGIAEIEAIINTYL